MQLTFSNLEIYLGPPRQAIGFGRLGCGRDLFHNWFNSR